MSKSRGARNDGENDDDDGEDDEKDGEEEEEDDTAAVTAVVVAADDDDNDADDDATADGERRTKLFAWAFMCVPVASRYAPHTTLLSCKMRPTVPHSRPNCQYTSLRRYSRYICGAFLYWGALLCCGAWLYWGVMPHVLIRSQQRSHT